MGIHVFDDICMFSPTTTVVNIKGLYPRLADKVHFLQKGAVIALTTLRTHLTHEIM